MESIEIKLGQEYISTSDKRTRKITSIDKETVSFICIDCETISRKSEAKMSYDEFQRCVKNKIFEFVRDAPVIPTTLF